MKQVLHSEMDKLLAGSFKEIASVKAIEKITIREITDRAGVIRPTFYNHFQDKYELLEWIMRNELLEPVRPLLDKGQLKEAFADALERMQTEQPFYERAAQLEGQNSFAQTLEACISELILERVNPGRIGLLAQYEWLTPRMAADFYAGQICHIVMLWIRAGMRFPASEVTDALIFVMRNSPLEIFREVT